MVKVSNDKKVFVDGKERELVRYLSYEEIQEIVRNLAQKINHRMDGREIVPVCIANGAFIFFSDLARMLNNCYFSGFLRTKRYSKTENPDDNIELITDIDIDVKDKTVLLIDEIFDGGKTLEYAIAHIREKGAEVLSCCFLDKNSDRRMVEMKPDFTGKVTDDLFFVGYGMDCGEFGRTFKDIYYLS